MVNKQNAQALKIKKKIIYAKIKTWENISSILVFWSFLLNRIPKNIILINNSIICKFSANLFRKFSHSFFQLLQHFFSSVSVESTNLGPYDWYVFHIKFISIYYRDWLEWVLDDEYKRRINNFNSKNVEEISS